MGDNLLSLVFTKLFPQRCLAGYASSCLVPPPLPLPPPEPVHRQEQEHSAAAPPITVSALNAIGSNIKTLLFLLGTNRITGQAETWFSAADQSLDTEVVSNILQ